jgi:hypothetical protein
MPLTERLVSALAIGATAFLATLAEGQTDSMRVSTSPTSPVRDKAGRVGGVLCIVSETTERVVAQQRQRLLLQGDESSVEELVRYDRCNDWLERQDCEHSDRVISRLVWNYNDISMT